MHELDVRTPAPRPTTLTLVATWPPYRPAADRQPAAALLDAAAGEGLAVRPKVVGPSDIGNLPAGECVPATAGFEVRHEGLHGVDEGACPKDLPTVHAVYRRAVLGLLGAP